MPDKEIATSSDGASSEEPRSGGSKRGVREIFADKWRPFWRGLYGHGPRYFLLAASFIYQNFSAIIARFLWAGAVLLIAAIVFRALTQHVTVIEPLSVPKVLLDRGYSPDVAAQRFRDAMTRYANSVNTRMRPSEVSLHTDLPNIVVPTVGISLDAVVSSIRTLLGSTRSQSVGGEFTVARDQLWLRLRLNGVEFYSSKEGGDPEKPDDLVAAAIPEAMKKTQPYFVAVTLGDSNDYDGAFELIAWIISNLPESDENVAWAYNLKGSLLSRRGDNVAAEEALRKALALNSQLAAAHLNLSNVRRSTGKFPDAIAECREAIKIDPKYAGAHNMLGETLKLSGRNEEAIQEYIEAIRLDPADPAGHNNYGVVLGSIGRDNEAEQQYREAIRLSPNHPLAHYNLAIVLATRKNLTEAVKENNEAIKYDPKNARAHNNLANLLNELGRNDEAMIQYREAVKLEPKNIVARSNLARTLAILGKGNDALTEFKAILEIDPGNEAAGSYLKDRSVVGNKPK